MEDTLAAALPLVVIAGPTASGKTALAIELAEKYGGEIICADSRTIYKETDIGTAKPNREEQARVRHWGIDLCAVTERVSAADFKAYAEAKIDEIRRRGHIPFLVGGSGLYIDGVVYDYQFGPAPDLQLRQDLQLKSLEELYKYCTLHNVMLPENSSNKRYVMRAIEQAGINHSRRQVPRADSIIVALTTDRVELRRRIEARIEHMLSQGVVEEANRLGKLYGWSAPGLSGNIYRLIYQLHNGEMTLAQLKEKASVRDWQLAKRQLTWFHRHKTMRWLTVEEARTYLSSRLATTEQK